MAKNTILPKNKAAGAVLVTGGSGAIGQPLIRALLDNGYTVHQLIRKGSAPLPGAVPFEWDVYKREIDPNCIAGIDAIIHLAGEPVAAKPWTNKRMQQIIESRTESIRLIYRLLEQYDQTVHTVISASAVGYYGNKKDELLTEESAPGEDFLGQCCIQWEGAADEAPKGVRVVKLRTGIVLHREDGALKPIAAAIKAGLGAPLGTGQQWMPWIHLEDAVRLYCYALENETIAGVYNMTAPNPVTNRAFTRILAQVLKKPLWLPRVPAVFLRILLGKMSVVALESTNTSSAKIESAGFHFLYSDLEKALKAIYDQP